MASLGKSARESLTTNEVSRMSSTCAWQLSPFAQVTIRVKCQGYSCF